MTIGNSNALFGFTNDASSTTANFVPGTDVMAGGTTYTYAKAAADIAAAGDTTLTGAFGATTTTTGTTHTHDVPSPGVKSGEYFWAKLKVSAI